MDLTDQERRVFQSLAHSSEGEVISGYIARLRDHYRDAVVDNTQSTLEELAGARQTRQALEELQNRFVQRDTITSTPEQFS